MENLKITLVKSLSGRNKKHRTFELQRQLRSSELPLQSEFFVISKHFTAILPLIYGQGILLALTPREIR